MLDKPAAEHDAVRVEQVDDMRQRPRQPPRVPPQRRRRARIPGGGAGGQRLGIARARPVGIGGERGAAEEGFDAAPPAAPAGAGRDAPRAVHPGQRVVAPLAGDAVAPLQQAPAGHDAGAGAGAEDGGEDGAEPGPGAVRRLAQRQAVGVVGDADGPAEARGQVRSSRPPFSQVLFAPRTSPVVGERLPGMPTPTVPRARPARAPPPPPARRPGATVPA